MNRMGSAHSRYPALWSHSLNRLAQPEFPGTTGDGQKNPLWADLLLARPDKGEFGGGGFSKMSCAKSMGLDPGFSKEPLDGSRHLLADLQQDGSDFLAGSDTDFSKKVQHAEALKKTASCLPP
jgi:hypothetical protein